MSLVNALKKRLVHQFISVIVYEESCNIKQKVIKGAKVIHKEEFNYDLKSKDELGAKIINFINSLQDEYDNTYISLFLNTSGQGVIPGCDSSKLELYSIDQKSVKAICKDKRFLMYSTHIDINWADKLFAKTGLDFIFSPFLILDFYFQKDMKKESFNKDDVILYILYSKNSVTMMIMQNDRLLYGSFFNTTKEEDLLNIDYSTASDSTIDEMEELDLDNIDELGMDDILDVGNDSNFANSLLEDSFDLSEADERVIKYIDTSLKEFYDNDLYESQFIVGTKIYDDCGINDGILKHLENELLLDTNAENISISDAVLELSIKEALDNV
ncbi:MAG: hypothetical protein DSZ06_04515 [Sulfurospirillum sp.]|nr:MAG: hypothetical protein DSZ06_04515 [Sulfurospirillum sp.]